MGIYRVDWRKNYFLVRLSLERHRITRFSIICIMQSYVASLFGWPMNMQFAFAKMFFTWLVVVYGTALSPLKLWITFQNYINCGLLSDIQVTKISDFFTKLQKLRITVLSKFKKVRISFRNDKKVTYTYFPKLQKLQIIFWNYKICKYFPKLQKVLITFRNYIKCELLSDI